MARLTAPGSRALRDSLQAIQRLARGLALPTHR